MMIEPLMYDTILNYYDIGPGWSKKTLQVKSITGTPLMRIFWLDPSARLWEVTCDGTHDFHEDEGESKFTWVANGKHGKCSPFYYSGKIIVVPERWDAYYAPYPECNLLFRDGILEVVTHLKKYV
jgi:hypothetical protein